LETSHYEVVQGAYEGNIHHIAYELKFTNYYYVLAVYISKISSYYALQDSLEVEHVTKQMAQIGVVKTPSEYI